MCAACAVLALALAGQPLAAQANQSGSSTGAAAAPAPIDESRIPLGSAPPSAAGTAAPAAPAAAPGSNVSTWDFVRMLLVLALVIGVIYFLFWLLRRGAGRRVPENDLIKVLGSRGLTGSRSLHLVEVGASVFLVGASDGGVQLISEITDKESLDSVRLKAAEEAPGRRTFQQALSEIFRPARRPLTIGDGLGFLKGQQEKLKKL